MTTPALAALALVLALLGGGSVVLLRGGRGVRWLHLALVGLAAVGLSRWLQGGTREMLAQLDVATSLAVSAVVVSLVATGRELRPGRPWHWPAALLAATLPPLLLFSTPVVSAGIAAALWSGACVELALTLVRAARSRPGSLLDARLRTMAGALVALALCPLVALGPIGAALASAGLVVGTAVLWVAVAPPPGIQLALAPTRELVRASSRELARIADPDRDPAEALRRIRAVFGAEAVVLTDHGRMLSDTGPAVDVAAGDTAITEVDDGSAVHGDQRHRLVAVQDRWVLVGDTGRGWLAVVMDHLGPLLSVDDRERVAAVAEQVGLALDRGDAQGRDRHAAASLRAIDRMRDDLLATLSHELRTPLTSIRGFSEVLREHGDKLGEVQRLDLLDRVVAKSGDLERMIGGLLELTAVRGRTGPERIARYDLRDLVDRAVGRAARRLGDRTVDVDVPHGDLITDGGAVLAVLDHLLDNVAKFTPPGSHTDIRARWEPERVTIEVSDDGPGLDGDDHRSMMDPFVRGGDVLTRETRGVGIGLSIARELAGQLGGVLEPLTPEHGAAFRFTFAVAHDLRGPVRTRDRATAEDAEAHHPDLLAPASEVARRG